jgi:hypothetical protein
MLFGVEDATHKFLYVNFGCQFRLSDGGLFSSSDFRELTEEFSLYFP